MKTPIVTAIIFTLLFYANISLSQSHDGHDHGQENEAHSDHSKHDHGKGHDHSKRKSKKSKKKNEAHDHHDHEGEHSGEKNHDHDSESGHGDGDHKGHDHGKKHKDKGASHEAHEHEHDEKNHDDHSGHVEHGDHGGHGDHDDHGGASKFGPEKAIVEVKNEGAFFKLSKEANQALKVKASPLGNFKQGSNFTVPKKSVVFFQNEVGIFVVENDWIQLVSIKVNFQEKDRVNISGDRLNSSMNLIIAGVPLVRVAHLEASGQGGQGHAH